MLRGRCSVYCRTALPLLRPSCRHPITARRPCIYDLARNTAYGSKRGSTAQFFVQTDDDEDEDEEDVKAKDAAAMAEAEAEEQAKIADAGVRKRSGVWYSAGTFATTFDFDCSNIDPS